MNKLIVCNPVMNAQYKRIKTDKLDAKNLALLLRGGYLSSVYHDGSKMEHLRALMSGYQDIVDTGVSLKNRYKSLFRKSGLPAKGSGIYSDDSLLADLPRPDQRFVAQGLYRMIEAVELERGKYYAAIKAAGRKSSEVKLLKDIPGIGEIHAVKIASQVIAAERFKDKHKFWSYCGLVRHKQQSAGGADVLGGGQTIDLKTASVFEKAVYFTLSSFWGAGPFRVRFRPFKGARAAGAEEFILANLALRRAALENNSLAFEGHLTSAEENLLLNKLSRLGSAMRLSEGLNLLHKRRPNYISFARQLSHSGMGRAQMTFLYPAGLSFFTTLPVLGLPVFVAGLFLAPALFKIAVYGYLSACAFFALKIAAVSGIKAACVSFSLFPVVHLSYAAGWWRGAFGMLADRLGGSKDSSRCVCGRPR